MIDEATYDELDRYFHSAMNADEKSAFESRLNASADLRAEYAWLNTMLGGMKQQGRSVMKSTIASAIAGIPTEQLEKYNPSVNKKSFFKKYWWAVTIAVVLIGAAIAIYLYATRNSDAENHDDHGGIPPTEAVFADDTNGNGADSCAEPLVNPAIDSIFKNESEGRIAIRETVDVHYNDVYYEIDNEKKVVVQPGVIVENDTLSRSKWKNIVYGGGVHDDPYKKDKTRNMDVTMGYRPFPPYTYKLDDDLMLNAPYYSCKGFKWQGMGSDTVYMTTKDGIEYMLLRGRGVKELVPIKGRGEVLNYDPVRK